MKESMLATLLSELELDWVNPGAYTGVRGLSVGHSSTFLASINPATGHVLAKAETASGADYDRLVGNATEAFLRWRDVPAPKRGELVRQLGEAIRLRRDALARLVSMETGKILAEARAEIQEMIDMADFAVGESRMLYGRTMHSERPMHRLYEQWHPLGPVGVISTFNFPVAIWSWNAFLAAICGDTVIWKPSPKAPLSAIAIQRLCERVMERFGQTGIFSLFLTEDNELAHRFVADQRVPMISFTGSVKLGRSVAETVSGRLGRCLLELGGNNAVIVDETADIDLAIQSVIFGALGTAGQRCTTIRRLFVHESIMPRFEAALLEAYRSVKIGDPLVPDTLVGPLIDAAAFHAFLAAIERIRSLSGEIVYGGRALDMPGFFVEPALVRARADWDIVQEETFGPILYMMSFRDFDEAIALNNGVPQGLCSALFTTDLRRAEQFLSHRGSDCGIANINMGTSGAEIGGAFGGEKDSGGGREAGSDSWKAYMRRQTNTIHWGSGIVLAQGLRFGVKR